MWLLQGILWSKYEKLLLEKKIASFWVINVTVKINLLHDQVRYITHEVDLPVLTHDGLFRQLAMTELNKLLDSVALISLNRS